MPASQPKFPENFTWGAATSAFQIEGAAQVDGKGPSVWDNFCTIPNKVRGGDTGAVTCDHYHRFREDVGLLAELQIPAYRFSISWPRVMPEGVGEVNAAGLDFYDSLVDELLAKGIEPWPTLFHWDYPLRLYERGGWLNPASPEWFADYVRIVVERLSDRVKNWFTINEPQCFIRFGHGDATNAPGLVLSLADRLRASHHTMLAHGRAVQTIRAHAKQPAKIGWAPVGVAAVPASSSEADIAAANLAMTEVPDILWTNTWYNDPVFFGHYPEEAERAFGAAMPRYTAEEMQTIAQPVDFLGLNIYTGTIVEVDDAKGYGTLPFPAWAMRSAFDWPIIPETLYWCPKFHAERYGVPLYITENGMANIDWVDLDGHVHDPQRIDYLRRYIHQVQRAINDGVDLRGYFLWSLLDNFEWGEGFSKRFGLVHVDFTTQQRTIKDSAYWYRELIRTNGASL
jgi:beta-glucosidase